MLKYRSLFTATDRASTVDDVFEQIHSWLRSKRYDADQLRLDGPVARIGHSTEAVATTEVLRDGTRSGLFLMREDGPAGAWTTQIVAQDPERRDDWVWVDLDHDGQNGPAAKPPRVVQQLLEVLDASDEGASLRPRPSIASADDVPALVDVLLSPRRRGLVFVAGTSDALPFVRWRDLVSRLLKDTVGLAAGYVLDPEATERLAELLGPSHAVAPGTLRTYLPGVDPASDLDALRHRFLTTETIVRTDAGRIARTLGQRANDVALAAALPQWAARTESRLLRATDERVLGWTASALVDVEPDDVKGVSTPTTTPRPAPEGAGTAPTLRAEPAARQESADATGDAAAAKPAGLPGGVQAESDEIAVASPDESAAVIDLKSSVAALSAQVDQLRQRNGKLNERVLNLEKALKDVRLEADDSQLEWTLALKDHTAAARNVDYLRQRLTALGDHEAAWAQAAPEDPHNHPPEGFEELLVRLEEFEDVVFTGAYDPCEDLDPRVGPGVVSKTWTALLALEGYARAKRDGFSGGVQQYLENTPAGHPAFPGNRHARDESEEVKNNPKFAQCRELPVPEAVNPSRTVFMGAHFKLAQLGLVSPRLHYHDATAVDGRVYVGYIGAHLPTSRTN